MEDVIFLSQRIPYPPDKGDKIRSFHILQHLAARFRVHLGCFIDDPSDEKYIEPLQALCASVHAVPLSGTALRLRAASALVRGMSFSEACFHDAQMAKWVRDVAAARAVRNGFVFSSAMAPYLANTTMHKVLDIVDVDSEKWRAYATTAKWPMSAVYSREAEKLLELERKLAAAFDMSIFVSDAEKQVFLSRAPEAAGRVAAMNNGVDTDYFDPTQIFPSPFAQGGKAIVFTGTMNYRPNIEAVVHFSREILPAIRARIPQSTFWIVGANPAPAVQELTGDAVRVTGQVGDIRPYLAHADCVVAPLKIARGVQNKVLEAMAMARPVVATPEAREGIEAAPGEEIVVAETPVSFAQAVCTVLDGNPHPLGEAARAYVKRHHAWRKNLELLDTLFPISAV